MFEINGQIKISDGNEESTDNETQILLVGDPSQIAALQVCLKKIKLAVISINR